jgi:hypothetical protein
MKANTWRYEPDDDRPSPAVYWRRRFVALLTGLAVLGTVAWAFSGVAGGGTGRNAADAGHARGTHRASTATGSAASAGTPAADATGPATPSPSAPASGPSVGYSPGPGSRHAGVARPQGRQPTKAPGPLACAPGDVVLTVFVSQGSYDPGQPPEFDLDVVSTADGTCAFNVGTRYLALVITAGRKRVWGSADCAAAPGSLETDLARGVPAVLPVVWDQQTSAPGCTAPSRQAAPGDYAATASGGGVTSNSVTFRLS